MMRIPFSNLLKPKKVLLYLSLTALCLVLSCCHDKKPEVDQRKLITQHPLLHYLPEDAVAFVIVDSTRKSYQAFKQSVWGESAFNLSDMLTHEQVSGANPSLAELLRDPAIQKASDQLSNGFAQSLVFGGLGDANNQPNFSVYSTASNNHNFTETIAVLRQIFSKQNLETSDLSYKSASGFRLKLQGPANQKMPNELYILSTSTKASFSSSELLAQRFFEEAPEQSPAFFSQTAYTTVHSQLDFDSDPFLVYYADLHRLLDSPIIRDNLQDAKSSEIKLEALSGIRFFRDKQLSDQVVISPAADPAGSSLFSSLSATHDQNQISLLSNMPDSVLLNLELGSALIRGLSILGNATDSSKAPILLEKASALSLGVTTMPGGSLFPSIIITLASQDPASARAQARELLNQLTSSSQLPLSSWQEKSVQDKKVDFMLSPLGIGVFLAEFSNGIVLTSSEQSLNDFFTAQQKPEARLASKLANDLKSDLSSDQNHLAVFGNVKRIVETVEIAQGNLSMFTGGAPAGQKNNLEQFKDMGDVSLTLRSAGKLLKLNVKYSAIN